MQAAILPSLEDLAFEMSYKEIMSNLILCYEHRPQGKRLPWLPFSSFLATSPFFSSQTAISLVRRKLDHYLVGTMSDKIRSHYVEKFYQRVYHHYESQHVAADSDDSSTRSDDGNEAAETEPEEEECIVDIWVFLDSVLDDTFQELETHVAFPETSPNSKLMPTIIKRSPHLKKLTLDFNLMKNDGETVLEELKLMMLSLSSFERLTSLCLSQLDDKLRPATLSHLGRVCPSLTHLSIIGSSNVNKKEVLALIVGGLLDELLPNSTEEPDWFKDSALDRLVVPSEFLSPLCNTLLQLHFRWEDDSDHQGFSASAAAFALRHFRSLQYLGGLVPTTMGVKFLHDAEKTSIQNIFEKSCRKAADRQGNSAPLVLQRNLDAPFSGFLSLTKLGYVNVTDRDVLKAIGKMCPALKEISFFEDSHWRSLDSSYFAMGPPWEKIDSSEELELILSEWPKTITSIYLRNIAPDYVHPILKIFGSELLQLQFSFKSKFYVEDLASASRLESLLICSRCELMMRSKEDAALLRDDNFLPQLKKLESGSCLGSLSYLFEKKTTLEKLTLECCHIGAEIGQVRPKKRFKPAAEVVPNQLPWNRIPELWQQMEVLNIYKCNGLTLSIVSNLVPQLRKLKTISLPYQIQSADLDLSCVVVEKLLSRVPSIELTFHCKSRLSRCPFMAGESLNEAS